MPANKVGGEAPQLSEEERQRRLRRNNSYYPEQKEEVDPMSADMWSGGAVDDGQENRGVRQELREALGDEAHLQPDTRDGDPDRGHTVLRPEQEDSETVGEVRDAPPTNRGRDRPEPGGRPRISR